MADENQEEIMTEMVEVTLQLFACRTCEMRFNSVEEVTTHINDEHSNDSVAKGISLKEEIGDDETTEAGYVIIEERQLIPQGLQLGEDQLFQLANGGENGQYVLHVIENDEELIEQQQQQQIAQAKSRSRKRKLVEKVITPQTHSTRSKRQTTPNIKSEFIYDNGNDEAETSMYTLVQDGNMITAWHNSSADGDISAENEAGSKHSEIAGNEDVDPNTSAIDPANQKFPDDYTPTHKVKKGRVNVPEVDDSALRKFPCPFQGCTYIAKYRSNLWDHKKTHTGEKPYVCTWPSCSMKFSQTHQLKLHLRSHTGERPYVCNWLGCNSSFSQKPGLKSHMLTHTGEKPFKCDFPGCGWTFRLKGALTDHKRAIHENAKKHICEWPGCNKRFLQQCHLKKHIMGHADIKPFSCDWPNCNYRAVTMAYVTNHRKTHTGEKNYECTYPNCNKRFVKSSHVNRHRARCHPDLYQMLADNTFEDEETEQAEGVIEAGDSAAEQRQQPQSRSTRSKAKKGSQQQIVYKIGQNGDEEDGEEGTIYIQSEEVGEEMVVSGEAVGQFINGDTVVSESGEHYIISHEEATEEHEEMEHEDDEEEEETPVVFKKEHLDEEIETEIEPGLVSAEEHHEDDS